ncbi:MAG: DUF4198 domain-containing protein [Chloroflexota bacterium]|nr:DUF4198 domain-containing protein [Chloroflexota bacterium]
MTILRQNNLIGIAILAMLVILTFISAQPASAHFTMLLPGDDLEVTAEDYIAERGSVVTLKILWGHPFEHILFDCPSVPQVHVRTPSGSVSTLSPNEITIDGNLAYEVSFTVEEIGDHIVYAELAAEEHGVVDHVKAIVHCGEEAWTGWDAATDQNLEIIPYTRPYGIEPGFVFSGRAIWQDGSAIAGATTEIEKYNTKSDGEALVAEAELRFPEDPPMMFTRVTTTNNNGEFSYTLDEPGIWFIGVTVEAEDELDERAVMIIPITTPFPEDVESGAAGTEDDSSDNTWAYVALAIAAIALALGAFSLVYRRR